MINVLLIEDNPGDARATRELLKESKALSIAMEWRDRLSSGLTRLSEGGVDLVLLDLSLPDSRGFSTFTQLSAKAQDLPVIVLTGMDDEAVALWAVREGAQDYIVKGRTNPRSLVSSIRFAVERNKKLAPSPTR